MTFNKNVKFFLSSLVILIILVILGSFFIGPGVLDFDDEIINGYRYFDTGGYEKLIVYTGNEQNVMGIKSEVSEFKIDGDKILVARRPVEYFKDSNGNSRSRLTDDCEYWVIDTKNHLNEKTSDTLGLHCK